MSEEQPKKSTNQNKMFSIAHKNFKYLVIQSSEKLFNKRKKMAWIVFKAFRKIRG